MDSEDFVGRPVDYYTLSAATTRVADRLQQQLFMYQIDAEYYRSIANGLQNQVDVLRRVADFEGSRYRETKRFLDWFVSEVREDLDTSIPAVERAKLVRVIGALDGYDEMEAERKKREDCDDCDGEDADTSGRGPDGEASG